ncbi:hypothetical protein WJX73_009933 [Symbiochloris irregularis]|uniref:Uncharacterized protein n=1 Tax=Symbiochloris irregularis TaxID=706552 RepID=A0AAW1PIE8_9CHLO
MRTCFGSASVAARRFFDKLRILLRSQEALASVRRSRALLSTPQWQQGCRDQEACEGALQTSGFGRCFSKRGCSTWGPGLQ